MVSNLCTSVYSRVYYCHNIQSFEESAPYRNYLYSFNYFASIVYTIEYVLRLIAAPLQYPDSKYWKARLRYVFSFYGIIDFVAILPFVLIYLYKDSPSMHMIVLAIYTYHLQTHSLLPLFPHDRLGFESGQRRINNSLYGLWHHAVLFRNPDVLYRKECPTASICQHRRWFLVGYRCIYHSRIWRHLSHHTFGKDIKQSHQPHRYCHDCHSYRYHKLGIHEHDIREKTERQQSSANKII